MMRSPQIAIVGAGVSGLSCAQTLRARGVEAIVFDKGRAPGGRLAGHRGAELEVDLGAPFFAASDTGFAAITEYWLEEGVIERWSGRVGVVTNGGAAKDEAPARERFVGVPNMNAVARFLARDLALRPSHRVDQIEARGGRLSLSGVVSRAGETLAPAAPGSARVDETTDFGSFDAALVCLPAEQAGRLLSRSCPALAEKAASVRFDPCFVLGLCCAEDLFATQPYAALRVANGGVPALAWIAREASKPARSRGDGWVVHSTAAWAEAHLGEPPDVVQAALLEALQRLLRLPPIAPRATVLRRWMLAQPRDVLAGGPVYDSALGVGLAGDWTVAEAGVQGAFISGARLAQAVLATL